MLIASFFSRRACTVVVAGYSGVFGRPAGALLPYCWGLPCEIIPVKLRRSTHLVSVSALAVSIEDGFRKSQWIAAFPGKFFPGFHSSMTSYLGGTE